MPRNFALEFYGEFSMYINKHFYKSTFCKLSLISELLSIKSPLQKVFISFFSLPQMVTNFAFLNALTEKGQGIK